MSEKYNGEANATPTQSERTPAMRNFVTCFILFTSTLTCWIRLLALVVEQPRSMGRTVYAFRILGEKKLRQTKLSVLNFLR